MTENELLEQLLERARQRGIYARHVPDSRRVLGMRGFPDLVLAGPKGFLVAELKSEGGQLARDQTRWRYRLQANAIAWKLWRPGDLDNGLIGFELDSIA